MPEPENISSKEAKPLKHNISEHRWYAIYTRPRAEKLVFQRLVEEGIETFLPLQKTYKNVEVINGSLIGLTGELIKIGTKNRVVVRIDRLDQNLILKIPKSFLRKV